MHLPRGLAPLLPTKGFSPPPLHPGFNPYCSKLLWGLIFIILWAPPRLFRNGIFSMAERLPPRPHILTTRSHHMSWSNLQQQHGSALFSSPFLGRIYHESETFYMIFCSDIARWRIDLWTYMLGYLSDSVTPAHIHSFFPYYQLITANREKI